MTDPCFVAATTLASEIRRGDRSPVDLMAATLDRIDRRDGATNAYVTLREESALEAAREAERAVERGDELGPLHGLPVAIKDLVPVAGVRTTFGAKPFAEFVPERNAPLVDRLLDAGAIVVGKTNTPAFGYKGVTNNRLFGPTGTPFAPELTAGGSSGGSAAAVADGFAAIAQGSDGGGSIRIPASACGVFGLKPTFGRIPSRNRPNAFLHTPFADEGPIARTVADAAAMLDVMAGPHPRDPLALPDDGRSFGAAVDRGVTDLRVAWSPDLGVYPVTDTVEEACASAVEALATAGATVERADPAFSHTRREMLDAWITGFSVRLASMAEDLLTEGVDLLGDHRDDLESDLVALLERGQGVSAVAYKRADVVRTAVFDAMAELFGEYDLLVAPTLAVRPFDRLATGPSRLAGEEIHPIYGWFLTWPFNMTGQPAASVPAGVADGLPVGLQVVAPRFREDLVLAAAGSIERERPWAGAYPPR